MSTERKPVVIKELHKAGSIKADKIRKAVLSVYKTRTNPAPVKPVAKAKRVA